MKTNKPQTSVQTPPSPAPAHQENVWDIVVRLFHWSLVICVLSNLFILEAHQDSHTWIGYTACGLIAIRMVWGFVGTRYARFSNFFPTPSRLRTYYTQIRSGDRTHFPGHNPLGALMMLTLMGLVIALGVSGYLMDTDEFWGEEWLENVHEWLANILLAAIIIHIVAALLMSRIEHVNLVRAMITGIKEWKN